MRRGDIRPIQFGEMKFEAEYLGKGRHATAYRVPSPDNIWTVYLFCKEDEYMKDILCGCDDMPHIPPTIFHGEHYISRQGDRRVYSMPYYPNITAKDKEAWKVLNTLTGWRETILRDKIYNRGIWSLPTHGLYVIRELIDHTEGKVPKSVSEALQELMNSASNYGSGVTVEFGKRNIGVDLKGQIVFRDILFDAEKLHKERLAVMNRQFSFRGTY